MKIRADAEKGLLTIKTSRALKNEPISVRLGEQGVEQAVKQGGLRSLAGTDGASFPAQLDGDLLTAVVTLSAGEHTLAFSGGDAAGESCLLSAAGENALDIKLGGRLFTRYIYSSELAKPYLGPVYTDDGESYTRLDFETKEHPHHRSVFLGVGDVTTAGAGEHVDFWNEPAACGLQRHAGIENIINGAASASFTAKTLWCAHDETPMLSCACEYKFYAQTPEVRYIDMSLTYTAEYGEVTFGATKEAGPLGVRVADVLRADRGGVIRNSYGALGEGECWGRAAVYCAYEGMLGSRGAGIAVFDHSDNERYPCTWHIRDYGLFAANNLYFKGGLKIPRDGSLTYKYRLVFYRGDHDTAQLCNRFIAYCK